MNRKKHELYKQSYFVQFLKIIKRQIKTSLKKCFLRDVLSLVS